MFSKQWKLLETDMIIQDLAYGKRFKKMRKVNVNLIRRTSAVYKCDWIALTMTTRKVKLIVVASGI